MTDSNTPDYLVIGSGLSALSVSSLLVKAGHKVTMLEAHESPGGYAHTFEVDHFQFCAQIHYIWGCAPGQTIHEFLRHLGLHEDVTFQAYDPSGYDVAVLPDGKRVGIPFGFDKLLETISAPYPEQKNNTKQFLDVITKLKYEMSQLPSRIKWWHFITQGWCSTTLIKYRTKTLQDVFDECNLSKEVQAILCCQTGDLGSPPETLSVLAYAGLFGGYNEGAYYPTRHFKYFVDQMAKVITDSPGSQIIYGANVTAITVENDKVTAVKTDEGKTYTADRIICNMDPQKAASMIGFNNIPESYQEALKYEYSPSSFIIYLGLENIDLRDHGFSNANLWHMTQWDMNKMCREQAAGDFSNPWLFISSPFLRTPDLSSTPEGCQNLEFGTLCSYEHFAILYESDRNAYKKLKEDLTNQFLDFLEQHHIPNLRKHIRLQLVGTPLTNENFVGAPRGNCYGSVMTPQNMGLSRLGPTSPWSNFFWCNASGGYAGTHGTILTGINLYEDLTGDSFLPRGKQMPTIKDNITFATQHAFTAKEKVSG